MMTRAGLGALLLLALPLSGCELEIDYHRVDESFTRDPTNGHFLRITKWQYGDGRIASTVDDMDVGDGNEIRRTQPPVRTGFVDPF